MRINQTADAGAANPPQKGRCAMDAKIMKYVPKSKQAAIQDCWRDSDGYWITLKAGWEFSNLDAGARAVSQDTISELRYQIAGIQKAV